MRPASSPLRRRLPWIAAGIVLLLIVAGFWPRALPVEAVAVARGPLVVTVDEEGMTRVRNRFEISSPVAGQLQRIELKPGAQVVAGRTQIAFVRTAEASLLDTRGLAEARARIQGAAAKRDVISAQLGSARAEARSSQADFDRLKTLFQSGTLSQRDFDSSETRYVTAQQNLRAAEFALQVAEFELVQAQASLQPGESAAAREALPIVSPVNGRILRVLQESERVVLAGTPLVEIGDTTDLEARIEVLSRDGVAIAPGARATLEKWGGAEPLQARVRLVEPAAFTKVSALGVEEQRVNVIVDITDPPEKRPTLGDAYRVEARIVVWESADALKAPSGALFQRAGGWHAYVLDGGRARLRAVRIGRGNGLETEIVEGLREGDVVIVYPGDRIAERTRVRSAPLAER